MSPWSALSVESIWSERSSGVIIFAVNFFSILCLLCEKISVGHSICHAPKIFQPPKKMIKENEKKTEKTTLAEPQMPPQLLGFNNIAINFATQSCHHHYHSPHEIFFVSMSLSRLLKNRWQREEAALDPSLFGQVVRYHCVPNHDHLKRLRIFTIRKKIFTVNEFSFSPIRQWGPSHWQLQLRRVNTFFKNAQTDCEVDLEFVCDWLIKNYYERYCEVDFDHDLPISQVHKLHLHTFHIFSNSRGL